MLCQVTGLTIEKGDLVPLWMMRIKIMCVVQLFASNEQDTFWIWDMADVLLLILLK